MAMTPYGPSGQTGPYNQKNDPWNSRRPREWKPTYVGAEGEGIMDNPQVQQWMAGLRGPDGAPLEDEASPPARFGSNRPSLAGLENVAGGVRNTIDTLRRGGSPLDAWLGGMPDARSGNNLRANQAIGAEVVRARQSEQRQKDPFGWSTLHMQPPGLGGTMEPFFNALVGKEAILGGQGKKMRVGWGGFGRTKAYDPVMTRMYDLESGEQPGEYTPGQTDYIRRSQPAMNALRRVVGLPGALI